MAENGERRRQEKEIEKEIKKQELEQKVTEIKKENKPSLLNIKIDVFI